MGAARGQLEVGVPTRHFIWRDFFLRRITVKVTVVSGSLHLEKKKETEQVNGERNGKEKQDDLLMHYTVQKFRVSKIFPVALYFTELIKYNIG